MDFSNWGHNQAEVQPHPPPPPPIDGGDWRSQLHPDSRQRIVNKILETLKRHLPFSGEEGLRELEQIATRFEGKIYDVATSQSDYLRKISLKMLTMETKPHNVAYNPTPSHFAARYAEINWVQNQGEVQPHPPLLPLLPPPAIDSGDWRSQLQPDSRQRIVNKITETLKRYLPYSGQEGLRELEQIAARFEGKIYDVAASQSDYLRKISLKMLTMESNPRNAVNNAAPSHFAARHPDEIANDGKCESIYLSYSEEEDDDDDEEVTKK